MRLRNLILSITLGTAITVGLVVALSLHATPAEAQPTTAVAAPTIDHSDAISRALSYLKDQQMPNGSFNDDEFTTFRAVIAVAAAGRPIRTMTSISGYTPLDYLATRAITYTHTETGTGPLKPGTAGQLAVVVAAGGDDPHNFGGMNIIHELTGTYNAATGAYSTTTAPAGILHQPWAILGLAAVQETVPVSATDYLIELQNADGGWGFPGWGSDPDTTAQAIQALIAGGNAGPTHAKVVEGLGYLRSTQLDPGGWGWGAPSADSTAAVIQALAAAGYTPATESWAHPTDPQTALLNLQQANGSFSGYNVVLSTADAVPGLAEAPLPILGRAQRANRALSWMKELQNPDGSWPTGGYGHPGGPTCDAVLAYAAAGFDPYALKQSGSTTSAMDYLASTAAAFVDISADSAGKLAIAVEAAGGDAHDFGGVNVAHVLTNTWYSPTVGAFGDANNSWHQAFAMMGLAAAGEEIPISATEYLKGLQNPDGSWVDAWGFDQPGSTGLALQALIAAGVPDTDASVVSGTSSLRNQQNAQGSWDAFGSPSANSTAYAMQGLLAAGEDLDAAEWAKAGHSPYAGLIALQKTDGPFVYAGYDNFFATRQAVPALAGAYYPFTRTLTPFASVDRGPDPDRMVAAMPRLAAANSVAVTIPFGSDLNANGVVTLEWRARGTVSWTLAAVQRADGYFTATLPVTSPADCQWRAAFGDPDLVHYRSRLENQITLPLYVYLPFVFRQ